jgi:HD-like signal output (HDOD) protein
MRALAQLHLCGAVGESVIHGGADDVVQRVHVTVGAELADAWSLPEYLRAAISRHHEHEVPADKSLAELHLVRVIEGISALRCNTITEAQREILQASARAVGLDHRMIRAAAVEHAELARKVSEIFGIADPGAAPAPRPPTRGTAAMI